jgi:hypothetical protein
VSLLLTKCEAEDEVEERAEEAEEECEWLEKEVEEEVWFGLKTVCILHFRPPLSKPCRALVSHIEMQISRLEKRILQKKSRNLNGSTLFA